MGEKFPAISSKDLVKILERKGSQFIRQSGTSHAIYKRFSDKRRVSVTMHGKTITRRGTLKVILKGAGMSLDDLKRERSEK
jgi:predicted RNA binding protein YcfA (HicA-like mRNA interferase family)